METQHRQNKRKTALTRHSEPRLCAPCAQCSHIKSAQQNKFRRCVQQCTYWMRSIRRAESGASAEARAAAPTSPIWLSLCHHLVVSQLSKEAFFPLTPKNDVFKGSRAQGEIAHSRYRSCRVESRASPCASPAAPASPIWLSLRHCRGQECTLMLHLV